MVDQQQPATPTKHEPLLTRAVLSEAWASLKSAQPNTLWLILFGLTLPQVVHTAYFDLKAASSVEYIRQIVMDTARNSGLRSPTHGDQPIFSMMATGMEFFGSFLMTSVILWCVFLASYFALLHLAVAHQRGDRAPLKESVTAGLKMLFPQGMALTGLLIFAGVTAQVLVAPAMICLILGLIAPVIIVVEKRGALSSTWTALSLRYCRGSAFSGWSALFALATVGAVFYLGLIALGASADFILDLDRLVSIDRGLWTWRFGDLPFGPVYIFCATLQTLGSVALIAGMPALTTALYFRIVSTREIARA